MLRAPAYMIPSGYGLREPCITRRPWMPLADLGETIPLSTSFGRTQQTGRHRYGSFDTSPARTGRHGWANGNGPREPRCPLPRRRQPQGVAEQ